MPVLNKHINRTCKKETKMVKLLGKEKTAGDGRVAVTRPGEPRASVLGSGSSSSGELRFAGDLRVDGHVEGEVSCGGLAVIGPEGGVHGRLSADRAEIYGRLDGELATGGLASLRSGCRVEGVLSCGGLSVEPGALFTGESRMPLPDRENTINNTDKTETDEKKKET
jgi:cytoskeletal protein CcmA (bactofilin family)